MLLAKALYVLLFVSLQSYASKKLTDKLHDQIRGFNFEVKQMLFIPGYYQRRLQGKLDRLIGIDSTEGKQRRLLSRLEAIDGTQQRLLSRLGSLETLVKKHKKVNDRRFLEKKDDNKTIIAFTVSSSSDLKNHDSKRIVYDKVITNTGNGYNKTTGIFTCPVSGTYVFTWSTMSRTQKQHCYACIYHKGHKLMMSHSYDGGGDEVASNTMVLSLKFNDEVWIGTTHGKYCYGYPYSGFSGWKL